MERKRQEELLTPSPDPDAVSSCVDVATNPRRIQTERIPAQPYMRPHRQRASQEDLNVGWSDRDRIWRTLPFPRKDHHVKKVTTHALIWWAVEAAVVVQ